MLRLDIPFKEFFNDETQEFAYIDPCEVELEHSLASISSWESKWKKPFLKTFEEGNGLSLPEWEGYLEDMLLPGSSPSKGWTRALTIEQVKEVIAYIGDQQTATTFYSLKKDKPTSHDIVTSEIIYYWMASLRIPFVADQWHLSRLLTLIRVASIKGQTGKKMSKREIMENNRALNEKRKKQYNTKG